MTVYAGSILGNNREIGKVSLDTFTFIIVFKRLPKQLTDVFKYSKMKKSWVG
jgi:hypothetical protein